MTVPGGEGAQEMRVAWISHSAGLFGAEAYLRESVEDLARRGVAQLVVFPYPGPLVTAVERTGAQVVVTPYPWWVHRRKARGLINLARTLPAALRLRAVLRSFRPDIVISNTSTIGAGALAAKLAGIPHVWHVHEFGERDLKLRFDIGAKRARRAIAALSNVVVFNSRAVATSYADAVPESKRAVVPQSVTIRESPAESGGREGTFSALVLARLEPRKAQDVAIRAVAKLVKERGRDIVLDLVGGGDEEYAASLRALARSLGVEDRLRFLPYFDEPSALIARSDVVLMCSPFEAFGRVTIEAMKLGTPVIGARAAGTAEIIEPEVNGLLYEPNDAGDLAENIDRLYCDPAFRRELGERGRQHARSTYNEDVHAAALLGVLRPLVPRNGARAARAQ